MGACNTREIPSIPLKQCLNSNHKYFFIDTKILTNQEDQNHISPLSFTRIDIQTQEADETCQLKNIASVFQVIYTQFPNRLFLLAFDGRQENLEDLPLGLNLIQEFNPFTMQCVGKPFKFDYARSANFSATYSANKLTIFILICESFDNFLFFSYNIQKKKMKQLSQVIMLTPPFLIRIFRHNSIFCFSSKSVSRYSIINDEWKTLLKDEEVYRKASMALGKQKQNLSDLTWSLERALSYQLNSEEILIIGGKNCKEIWAFNVHKSEFRKCPIQLNVENDFPSLQPVLNFYDPFENKEGVINKYRDLIFLLNDKGNMMTLWQADMYNSEKWIKMILWVRKELNFKGERRWIVELDKEILIKIFSFFQFPVFTIISIVYAE